MQVSDEVNVLELCRHRPLMRTRRLTVRAAAPIVERLERRRYLTGFVEGDEPSPEDYEEVPLPTVTVYEVTEEDMEGAGGGSGGSGGLQITFEGTDGAFFQANPAAIGALERAAARWATYIIDSMSIVIEVSSFNLNVPITASANADVVQLPYELLRSLLIDDAEADDDILDYLPEGSEAPFTEQFVESDVVYITVANALALGIDVEAIHPEFGGIHGYIAFNSTRSWDFNDSDGVGAGQRSFESTTIHEIGHVLGFVSAMDAGGSPIVPRSLDLFRFETGTANDPDTTGEWSAFDRSIEAGIATHFDDIEHEWAMSRGLSSADGRQGSHWRDDFYTEVLIGIMDPSGRPGFADVIRDSDLRALDFVGYDIAPNVAEAPDLTVHATAGKVGQTIDLLIEAELVDTDGSESLSIRIGDVPGTATLSAGTYDSQADEWVLTPQELQGLQITLPSGSSADFTLTVTARATEFANDDEENAVETLPIVVLPQGGFNQDSVIDDADIDLLRLAIHDTYDADYDLNSDSEVDGADHEILIRTVIGTEFGDTNLDGRVNISDLARLATFFGQSNKGWADGDVDNTYHEGQVNITDLAKLATYFGFDNGAESMMMMMTSTITLSDDGGEDVGDGLVKYIVSVETTAEDPIIGFELTITADDPDSLNQQNPNLGWGPLPTLFQNNNWAFPYDEETDLDHDTQWLWSSGDLNFIVYSDYQSNPLTYESTTVLGGTFALTTQTAFYQRAIAQIVLPAGYTATITGRIALVGGYDEEVYWIVGEQS